MKYVLSLDGDNWCCHDEDFINPQESLVGYGYTPNEAILAYQEQKIKQLTKEIKDAESTNTQRT